MSDVALNVQNAILAGIWTALAGVLAYRARKGNRLRAARWMIAIAAFLVLLEDPAVLVFAASTTRQLGPGGALGLVDAHVRGHLYGGAILALAGLVMCTWVARSALRRGERWAWSALLVFLLIGASIDTFEVMFIYPHGFPIGAPTPPNGTRGFGWTSIAAWIGIWAFALWYCRPQLRRADAS